MMTAPKKPVGWAVLDPRGVVLLRMQGEASAVVGTFEKRHSLSWQFAQQQGYELCEIYEKGIF